VKIEEQSLTTSPVTAVSPGNIDPLEGVLIGDLRPGQICPHCNVERLDYDGMLNLVCPRCGLAMGGCFT